MYAGGECWRWYARGVSGFAGHRAQMGPNGIVTHTPRPARPARPGGAAQGEGVGRCDEPGLERHTSRDRNQAINQPWRGLRREAGGILATAGTLQCEGKGDPGHDPDRSGRKHVAARAVPARLRFPDCTFHSTLLPLATVIKSPCLGSGGKRQALSAPSPGKPTLGPACRYLSLQFQTIQSCSPVRGPIATAVRPWRTRECAYTI
jgi:hypothetical protein